MVEEAWEARLRAREKPAEEGPTGRWWAEGGNGSAGEPVYKEENSLGCHSVVLTQTNQQDEVYLFRKYFIRF